MICPNCGKKVKGKICKYCNAELPYDERALARDNFITNFCYIFDSLLCPPAKVMFVFWTLDWIALLPQNQSNSFFSLLAVVIFGYFFMCGIPNALYFASKKRKNAYQIKIIEKKRDRLQKTMDKYFPYKKLLNEAHKLENVINTTIDENTFETSYNRLIDVLQELRQYEHLKVFTSSPTEDLNNLYYQRESATKSFYERKAAAENHIEESTQSVITKSSNLNFDNMDGHDFEYYCADILKKNGFSNVEVTQGSGDHGIDILADKEDISYAIQCKCYSSNIGNAAVQQAHTGKSLYHKDIAVVLTNQYFTTQAKEEANALGVKLWDRDKLQEMINNIN